MSLDLGVQGYSPECFMNSHKKMVLNYFCFHQNNNNKERANLTNMILLPRYVLDPLCVIALQHINPI